MQLKFCLTETRLPKLATIEQLRALKANNPVRANLDAALGAALGEDDATYLGLAWPNRLADEAAPLSYFLVTGLPSGAPERGIEVNSILDQLRSLPTSQRVPRLDRMRIQAFTDDDDAISSLLPARRWLSFETSHDDHRYCMHDGRWYMVDDGLDSLLTERLSHVFDQSPPFSDLPPWPVGMNEDEYNLLVAAHLGGVCLDRRLVQCKISPVWLRELRRPNTWRRIHTYQNGGPKHGCEPSVCSGWSICSSFAGGLHRQNKTARDCRGCRRRPRVEPVRPETAVLVMGNNFSVDRCIILVFIQPYEVGTSERRVPTTGG